MAHGMLHRTLFLLALLPLVLTACGAVSGPRGGAATDTTRDGAPLQRVDIAAISDAVPRHEPRSKYGNPATYAVAGKTYRIMSDNEGYQESGIASWYGTKFHGRRTSSGEPYDMHGMTAAHKTLPLPTYAEVTNLQNGRKVIVKVNDRGPFHENRLIDLSYAAASKLGILATGTGLVDVRAITPGRTPDAQEPLPEVAASGVPSAQEQPPVNDKPRAVKLYLQVGAFRSRDNAERLRVRIDDRLYKGTVTAAQIIEGQLYRVQIGPFAKVEEVDRFTRDLGNLGIRDTQVIVDPEDGS